VKTRALCTGTVIFAERETAPIYLQLFSVPRGRQCTTTNTDILLSNQTASGEESNHRRRRYTRGRRGKRRRCRAGERRTARSRTPPPSASPTSTPTSRSASELLPFRGAEESVQLPLFPATGSSRSDPWLPCTEFFLLHFL
jgi:hypothetical protein